MDYEYDDDQPTFERMRKKDRFLDITSGTGKRRARSMETAKDAKITKSHRKKTGGFNCRKQKRDGL